MKKIVLCLMTLLMVFLPLLTLAEEGNLVSNGSFEELTGNGMPQNWSVKAYRSQPGYGIQRVTDDRAHTGQRSVMLENIGNNDSRFTATVRVKPSSLYKLSAWVWVDEVSGGNGANLALEEFVSVSDTILEPTEGWQYLEWYGETGPSQNSLTFGVRLGGYGKESTGRVYFDDVSLEPVNVLPKGVFADIWYQEDITAFSTEEETDPFIRNIAWIIAGGIVFLLLFLLLYDAEKMNRKTSAYLFLLFMLFGISIRIILALFCKGYQVDINCFKGWSMRAASVGLKNFYAEDYFCDYPPAAILLLLPIGKLLNRFGANASVSLLLVKLLPILADLLGAAFLFVLCRKRNKFGVGLLLSALYILNPVVLVTGAAWGQIDSVLALLIVISVYEAVEDRWEIAIPVYTFAALMKLQALLVGPLALVFLILRLVSEKESRKMLVYRSLMGLGMAAIVAVLTLLPFLIGKQKPISWIINLYGSTLGSYEYATINAANLYELLGANWTALSTAVPLWGELILLLSCLIGIWCLGGWKKTTNLKNKWLALLLVILAAFLLICALASLNYAVMGYGLLCFVYLFGFLCIFLDKKIEHLPYYLALVICGLFVFSVKIHERYLFIAIPLFLLAYFYTDDKRILGLCVGFSLSSYLNTAIVLNNCILYGSASGHLLDSTYLLNKLIDLANLGLIGFAGWMAVTGLRPSPVKADSAKNTDVLNQYTIMEATSPKLGLRLQDWGLMLLVTAAYGVLCFSNLGSTVAPQTAYVSSTGDETVILKLDEPAEFSVLYYAGLSYYDFSIAVSEDGVNWEEEVPCEMSEGLCYCWKYAVQFTDNGGEIQYSSEKKENVKWFTGQYLRLTACETGLNLWEIVARDRQGSNLALSVFSHEGSISRTIAESYPAKHLCDERETCIGEPSWFNGTYFDEIYYARTGYELLKGQSPYEVSHPPLGKLLMAVSIHFFGMTPFAWRFPGAFLGMLMLPVMYILCYQLIRKRSAALSAMLAMGLGLMHFTQTRLATIDTFPVFFIMLSYLFMFRFLQSDFYAFNEKQYRKSLLSLFWSGLFLGLSIASKWTGIYAGIGLAILFFAFLIRRNINALPEDTDVIMPEGRCLKRSFVRLRSLLTCCWCVLFFIAIPAVLYYAAFIPFFAYSGGITLQKLVDQQIGMFRYHSTSGLGVDHPFYSPWWQWILLMKPMWYAKDAYEPEGFESTIMCFGNQWVVYLGDLAILALLVYVLVKFLRKRSNSSLAEELQLPWMILVGFAAQLVPWMLVPRGTYIYHFFACIPFLILATMWWLGQIQQKKWRYGAALLYIIGALVFFVIFFPYASGRLTEIQRLIQSKKLYAIMDAIPGFSAFFKLWY